MSATRYVKLNAGQLESVQAVDTSATAVAGNLIALNSIGKLDDSLLMSSPSEVLVAGENLTAGNVVYIADATGVATVYKSDATDDTKPAIGFVMDTVVATDPVRVFFSGTNTGVVFVAGDTGKEVFLSETAGALTTTAPSTVGNYVQRVGIIVGANKVRFLPMDGYTII